MKIVSGASTDTGQVREVNEDSYLVDRRLELFAVADGMGGHRAGEVASATALDGLRAAVEDGAAVADAVGLANTAVWDRASADTALAGMGTTLTAAFFDGVTLTIGHVGDSRGYLFRGGRFEQLTIDHSLVAELVRDGKISEEQAAVHPQRSIITRALGVDSTVDVDVYSLALEPDDRVMLCSDGLTSMVRARHIAEILRDERDPTAAANALVDAANAAGGEDNITVVVLDAVGEGTDPLPSSVAAALRGETRPAGAEPAGDAATGDGEIEIVGAAPVTVTTERTSVDATASREPPGLPRDTARFRPAHRPRGFGRRVGRFALFALPILVILGVAIGAIGWYARNSYYVTFNRDVVTVFQGRPGGLFVWDPTVVERTAIHRKDLSQFYRQGVGERKDFSSESAALAYLARIRKDARHQRTQTTPTTTLPTVPTPVPQGASSTSAP